MQLTTGWTWQCQWLDSIILEVFPNPNYSVIPWLFSPNPAAVSTLFPNRASKSSYLSIDGSNFPNQLQMLMNRDGLRLPTARSVSLHGTGNKLYVDLMESTKNFTHSSGGMEGEYFSYVLLKRFGLTAETHMGVEEAVGGVGGFLFAAINCQLKNRKRKKKKKSTSWLWLLLALNICQPLIISEQLASSCRTTRRPNVASNQLSTDVQIDVTSIKL